MQQTNLRQVQVRLILLMLLVWIVGRALVVRQTLGNSVQSAVPSLQAQVGRALVVPQIPENSVQIAALNNLRKLLLHATSVAGKRKALLLQNSVQNAVTQSLKLTRCKEEPYGNL
jgi:hypothetical protein